MIVLGSPSLPLFQARATAAQTLTTANTWYSVDLDYEDFDEANGHSPGTNPSRYTVQRAGTYRIGGAARFVSGQATTAGTTPRAARIVKNGTIDVLGTSTNSTYSANILTVVTPTVLVTLAVGDYVELQALSSLASSSLTATSTNGSVLYLY